jgi:hypothetical protein
LYTQRSRKYAWSQRRGCRRIVLTQLGTLVVQSDKKDIIVIDSRRYGHAAEFPRQRERQVAQLRRIASSIRLAIKDHGDTAARRRDVGDPPMATEGLHDLRLA